MQVTLIEFDPRSAAPACSRAHPLESLAARGPRGDRGPGVGEWGIGSATPTVDVNIMRARKEKVITSLSGGLKQLAKKRKVTVVNARASFVDSQTLRFEKGVTRRPTRRTA